MTRDEAEEVVEGRALKERVEALEKEVQDLDASLYHTSMEVRILGKKLRDIAVVILYEPTTFGGDN